MRSEGVKEVHLLKSRDPHLAGGESNHIPRVGKNAPCVSAPRHCRGHGGTKAS